MFLLEERKTGLWQRTFTLPHNIEMKALKARLEGGLLRIDILTRDVSGKQIVCDWYRNRRIPILGARVPANPDTVKPPASRATLPRHSNHNTKSLRSSGYDLTKGLVLSDALPRPPS
jgi:Hsp20/alpha crystallin family